MSAQEMPSSGGPPRSGKTSTKRPEACPKCHGRMVVKQISSVLFASNLDDMVFACEKCGTEVKRTVKRA